MYSITLETADKSFLYSLTAYLTLLKHCRNINRWHQKPAHGKTKQNQTSIESSTLFVQ